MIVSSVGRVDCAQTGWPYDLGRNFVQMLHRMVAHNVLRADLPLVLADVANCRDSSYFPAQFLAGIDEESYGIEIASQGSSPEGRASATDTMTRALMQFRRT